MAGLLRAMPQRAAWLSVFARSMGDHYDAYANAVDYAGQEHARDQGVPGARSLRFSTSGPRRITMTDYLAKRDHRILWVSSSHHKVKRVPLLYLIELSLAILVAIGLAVKTANA